MLKSSQSFFLGYDCFRLLAPFSLPRLSEPQKAFTAADMKGKVWMLNVWASWCVACRQEHPVLVELSRGGAVPIYGLNYKDQRPDALQWLQRFEECP